MGSASKGSASKKDKPFFNFVNSEQRIGTRFVVRSKKARSSTGTRPR